MLMKYYNPHLSTEEAKLHECQMIHPRFTELVNHGAESFSHQTDTYHRELVL